MSQKTDQELFDEAYIILNATQDGENTASRIAQMYIDIIDSKYNRDENIKPYKVFSANLTQVGKNIIEETINSGTLTKGVCYKFTQTDGGDFSNLGAPDNNIGTTFLCTENAEPNNWGNGATQLVYRSGLPVCNVFENDFDNIYFDFDTTGQGQYALKCDEFVNGNMFVSISHSVLSDTGYTTYVSEGDKVWIVTYAQDWSADDDRLSNTSIEIRVYN